MRKLWYAGAVIAGGLFLFGAAPAQADLLPGTGAAEQQADQRLADLLGQSNGLNVDNPLRYSTLGTTPLGAPPVLQYKSGQNTPDLNPVLPGESAREPRPDLPAADVVGGALRGPTRNMNVRRLPLQGLPVGSLLGGLLGGVLPNGGTPSFTQRPTARQAEIFDGGMPLLGGLGGLLPVNDLPKPKPKPTGPDAPGGPAGPDTAGLPGGGVAVMPAATTPPAFGQPADAQQKPRPAATPDDPRPAVTPDDPRLHEEPVDGENTPRPFSANGRPVAGIDQQYK